jgi:hypothetical protein
VYISFPIENCRNWYRFLPRFSQEQKSSGAVQFPHSPGGGGITVMERKKEIKTKKWFLVTRKEITNKL